MYLETERLIIRSIHTSDEKAFIEMASDGSLTEIYGDCSECDKWMGEFISEAIKLETEDNPYNKYLAFTIEDKTSHLVIGSVGSSYYEDFMKVGVTYFIGANYRGNGYAAEALQCFADYMFAKYNLKKLVATANVQNIASCKTLERAGFSVVETKMYRDLYDEKEEMSNIYELMKKSKEKYLQDLKKWLQDTSNSPLEEMSDFFTKRLDDYEEHMSVWEQSYQMFAESLPSKCHKILDLGCGTGLELDKIWKKNPGIEVTGVDLCQSMLDKLLQKHSDKRLTVVCQDYFRYDFGCDKWDAVISFESLHHFLPERKKELYQKVYNGLKHGGVFVLGDYIACCDEEEDLLRSEYLKRRKQFAIPDNSFVHFDIPLTLEHERELLQNVGFKIEKVFDNSDGATIIIAWK